MLQRNNNVNNQIYKKLVESTNNSKLNVLSSQIIISKNDIYVKLKSDRKDVCLDWWTNELPRKHHENWDFKIPYHIAITNLWKNIQNCSCRFRSKIFVVLALMKWWSELTWIFWTSEISLFLPGPSNLKHTIIDEAYFLNDVTFLPLISSAAIDSILISCNSRDLIGLSLLSTTMTPVRAPFKFAMQEWSSPRTRKSEISLELLCELLDSLPKYNYRVPIRGFRRALN